MYTGIKRCIADQHIHLPTITNYIGTIIGRSLPEDTGKYEFLRHLLRRKVLLQEESEKCEMGFRERHAKTMEVAQEEVLTCLGMCMAERLHKVHRRVKEEETVCRVLAAVAVDALSRNFKVMLIGENNVNHLIKLENFRLIFIILSLSTTECFRRRWRSRRNKVSRSCNGSAMNLRRKK